MSEELLTLKDPKAKALIKQAIKLASTIEKKNLPRFFSMLRRETNYLFACMMLRFLNWKRSELVHMMAQASGKLGVDLYYAAKMLMFEDVVEAGNFIEVCGYTEFREGRYFSENRISS